MEGSLASAQLYDRLLVWPTYLTPLGDLMATDYQYYGAFIWFPKLQLFSKFQSNLKHLIHSTELITGEDRFSEKVFRAYRPYLELPTSFPWHRDLHLEELYRMRYI